MFKKNCIIGLFLYILVLLSCKREYIHVNIESKKIGSNIDIESMLFLSNDTVFLCGGLRAEKGEIFKSVDGGKNWNKVYEGVDKLYSFYFSTDYNQAFAVGDSMHIEKSFDHGNTWKTQVDLSYLCAYDRTSIRRIFFFNQSDGFAIGNQSRENGNTMYTNNKGDNWTSIHGSNGLNDWWVFNKDSIIAVGYGIILKISNLKGNKPITTPLPLKNDYFTGVWFIDNNTGFVCGFNGGIYKTNNGGQLWKEIYKSNSVLKKRIHFNDILFESDLVGWVSGYDGVLMKTTDGGNSWKHVKTYTNNNLKNMFYQNTKLYITSENGCYFIISE